jgi:hypothetical protein
MPAAKKNTAVSQTVTWRKTGEEAVILDMETSEYYSANGTGTFIWELLNAGEKPDKIAKALAAEYGIPEEQAAADAAEFLHDLAKLKIIRTETGK